MTNNNNLFGTPHSVKGMVLKVSPNSRYFTDQDGKPFFYLGDTAWTLFKRLNHEDMDIYFKTVLPKALTLFRHTC